MKRDIFTKLEAWKSSPRRKPLILRGARQVGKTYALQNFAETSYEQAIYLNFDEDTKLCTLFERDLKPERIINDLGIYLGKSIQAENTLLIFDEIQECPKALNSLKYFCEQKNEYHIAAAGSLLGVKLSSEESFPVGKVNFLDLGPFSFFEFLDVLGHSRLRQLIENKNSPDAIGQPFHDELVSLLTKYFYIGGMPEAVASYRDNQDLKEVREIQKEILDAYVVDFTKHAPKFDLPKIMAIWNLIPSQLAKENKKFIFTALGKSVRAREYESAIQWLSDAGLIIKSFHIATPKLPMEGYADQNIFKVFLLDIGLLSAMSDMPAKAILEGDKLFTEFKGALTENYVAQTLRAKHINKIYYWTSSGTAEIDFVIPHENHIYPLEVKAGISNRKKSLVVYGDKYNSTILSRTTLMDFALDGEILNYPLYAISLFPTMTSQKK